MPKSYAYSGKQFSKFFAFDKDSGKYTFQRISGLKHCGLRKLLQDKYHLKAHEAESLADFLMPMLFWRP